MTGARCVGRPGVDAGGERRHGEKQRGRKGERGTWGSFVNKLKFKIKFIQFFSFFLVSNEKLLNTKVVPNFEIFNFCFRHFFI